jgi:hypothetical protein
VTAADDGNPGEEGWWEELGDRFLGEEEDALAAVDDILADAMATVAGAYGPDRSEWESVLVALRNLLDLFVERPESARLTFIEIRQSMPESAHQRYEAGFAILTAMLERLREQGGETRSPPPPQAARAAIGGGEALIRRELVTGNATQLPAILSDLVYVATVPFLGQQEALRLARGRIDAGA